MEQLNRVHLRGYVGMVKRSDNNGKRLNIFSLVTNYIYKASDGTTVQESTWHEVTAAEGDGVSRETLDKMEAGSPVEVVGRLKNIKFTASDGKQRISMNVTAHEVKVLDITGWLQVEK